MNVWFFHSPFGFVLSDFGSRIVLQRSILDRADRPAREHHGVLLRAQRDRHVLILDGRNGAVQAADRADTVAGLQQFQHVL